MPDPTLAQHLAFAIMVMSILPWVWRSWRRMLAQTWSDQPLRPLVVPVSFDRLRPAIAEVNHGLEVGHDLSQLARRIVCHTVLDPVHGLDRALLLLTEDDGGEWLGVRAAPGFLADESGLLDPHAAHRPWLSWRAKTHGLPGEHDPRETRALALLASRRLPLGAVTLFEDASPQAPRAMVLHGSDPRRAALGPFIDLLDESVLVAPVLANGRTIGLLVGDAPYTQRLRLHAPVRVPVEMEVLELLLEHLLLARGLHDAQDRYRGLIDDAREGIALVDLAQGRIVQANPALCRMTHAPRDGLARTPLASLFHPEDMLQLLDMLSRLEVEGQGVWQGRLLPNGQQAQWVEIRGSMLGKQPTPMALLMLLDMTERLQHEASVRSFARFTLANPNLILQLDAQGNVCFTNARAQQVLAESEMTSDGLLLTEPLRRRLPELAEQGGMIADVEQALGERVYLLTLVGVPEEGTVNLFGVDITDRKRLEDRLHRSEKMESLGTLAGSIAHDFGNILSGIMGNTSLLLAAGGLDDQAQRRLQTVEQAAARGERLTRQLRDFARGNRPEPTPVSLTRLTDETMLLLGGEFGAAIDVQLDCDADAPTVMADPTQLQSIFLNLCLNARDAMPHGGCLRVSVHGEELDDAFCRVRKGLAPGAFVVWRVADTGQGMDEETRARIFEPFFTTKPRGQGTGLGLSSVYGVVTGLGGAIEVRSAPGRGTTFELYLPACDAPAAQEEVARQVATSSGNETVLLVEDEDALRGMAEEILAFCGYRVVSAGDGEAALALFDADPTQIDLVLADLNMPRMGGLRLARTLRERGATLPILLTTGQNVEPEQLEGLEIAAVIIKPYLVQTLADAIQQALAAVPRETCGVRR